MLLSILIEYGFEDKTNILLSMKCGKLKSWIEELKKLEKKILNR